jgi:hypothetical protein
MASSLEQSSAVITLSSMGANGSILVTDTTAITGSFRALQVITDCVFTTLTTDITKNGIVTATTGSDWGTLSAGSVIYGRITECTLLSGKVQLFK